MIERFAFVGDEQPFLAQSLREVDHVLQTHPASLVGAQDAPGSRRTRCLHLIGGTAPVERVNAIGQDLSYIFLVFP